MAAILVDESGTQGNGFSHPSLPIPAAVTAGDTIVVWAQSRNATMTSFTPTIDGVAMSERSLVGVSSGGLTSGGPGFTNEHMGLWTLPAEGDETEVVLPYVDGGVDGLVAYVMLVRGGEYQDHDVAGGTASAPSVDGTDGGLLLVFYGSSYEQDTIDPATEGPAGMTAADTQLDDRGVSNDVQGYLFYEALDATGATGTRSHGDAAFTAYTTATAISFSPTGGSSVSVLIGQAVETDTARPISAAQPIGRATETATARAITPSLETNVNVGRATETDTARVMTPVVTADWLPMYLWDGLQWVPMFPPSGWAGF